MHITSSSPAKTGDPVFQSVGDGAEKPRHTGYSAGACHRARPVAEYDGLAQRDVYDLVPAFLTNLLHHLQRFPHHLGRSGACLETT